MAPTSKILEPQFNTFLALVSPHLSDAPGGALMEAPTTRLTSIGLAPCSMVKSGSPDTLGGKAEAEVVVLVSRGGGNSRSKLSFKAKSSLCSVVSALNFVSSASGQIGPAAVQLRRCKLSTIKVDCGRGRVLGGDVSKESQWRKTLNSRSASTFLCCASSLKSP